MMAAAAANTPLNAPKLDYLVKCHYDQSTQRLYLSAGSFGGDVVLFHVNVGEIQPVGLLRGGHVDQIRSCYWDTANQTLLTGGEDSRICLWTPQPPSQRRPAVGKMSDIEKKRPKFSPY
eukprot:GILI01040911.1.p1 GENE.GILI01040911.1~~GILI01040911.1.p1  ORF type:complete len:132 (+),score=23.58 GILI01040911.1:42-398(+)